RLLRPSRLASPRSRGRAKPQSPYRGGRGLSRWALRACLCGPYRSSLRRIPLVRHTPASISLKAIPGILYACSQVPASAIALDRREIIREQGCPSFGCLQRCLKALPSEKGLAPGKTTDV